jgi:SM-20-related protein
MIDHLHTPGFLDAGALAEIRSELVRAAGAPATVLGDTPAGVVHHEVRRTTRVALPEETRERVARLFREHRPVLEAHFGLPLGECEEPQCLKYEEGDYFVAHQDGNTPLVYDRSRFRRISLVLFLSTHADHPAPETYGGGALVFHGSGSDFNARFPVNPPAGSVIAFRSETTHEVTPVTHGERYTIVTWFHAAGSPPA